MPRQRCPGTHYQRISECRWCLYRAVTIKALIKVNILYRQLFFLRDLLFGSKRNLKVVGVSPSNGTDA